MSHSAIINKPVKCQACGCTCRASKLVKVQGGYALENPPVHGGGECGDAFSGYMTARVQGLLGEPLEFSKPKAKRKRRGAKR